MRDPSIFIAGDRYSIHACRACGIRFLDPQPDAAALEVLYGEQYFAHRAPGAPGYDRYLAEIENIRSTFDDRLQYLPDPRAGNALIDVGAAVGLFVERARAVGWNAEGVEPSQWAAGYARDILGQPVRHAMLETAGFAPGSADVVTMWEVIEHLPDPACTLRAVRDILRPGGSLVLSTPDAGSRVARLLGRRWLGWSKVPEHLFFFDRPTLRRVLEECGFQVESMRYVPLVVSRQYLLDRVGQMIGINAHRRLPQSWLERPVRINPLYDLLVAARRL
ncbi:MAG TPA: class I SAM-dependent methyltransferase [Gemmatimonadales bacterium]